MTSLGTKILKRRYRSTSHEGHRRKKGRGELQSALQVASRPLSPPGELQRSARSSGGLKNSNTINGGTKVHFKSLDAAKERIKGKKRSKSTKLSIKSRPGSPPKKNSKKNGRPGSGHRRRVKRSSTHLSEDSDCTDETRLVAPGCVGCAADDESSGAPVIQRLTVSRDQN